MIKRLAWRWFTGQKMFRPAPLPAWKDANGQRQAKARRAWYAACRRRMRYRHIPVVLAGAVGYGLHEDRALTIHAGSAVLLGAVLLGGGALVYGISQRRHETYERKPLWSKLAAQIPDLPEQPDRKALEYGRNAERLRIVLPRSFDAPPGKQWHILNTIERHTGRDWTDRRPGHPELGWHFNARPHPYVALLRVPTPKPLVPWAEVRPMLEGLDDSQLILGIDGFGEPILHNIDQDASHILVNIGTNYGKSTYMYFLGTQFLLKPATERLIICDPKVQSLSALAGINGVTYASGIDEDARAESMTKALAEVVAELNARASGATRRGRWVVFIEEANQFGATVDGHWSRTKGGQGGPPPARAHLATIVQMGRQFNINVVVVAQHASVAAIGGGSGSSAGGEATRGQFGKVIFSAFAPNVWKSFTGEPANQAPRLPDRKGAAAIWTRTNGGRDRVTLPLILPTEAAADARAARGDATTELPAYIEPLYSLREASADAGTPKVISGQPRGVVPVNHAALRARKSAAAKRGQAWPAGVRERGVERWTEAQLRQLTGIDEPDRAEAS